MNFLKKQSAGSWISILTAILTLVSLIVYAVNIGGAGYFQGASVSNLVLCCVIVIVLLAAVVAIAQVKGNNPVLKLVSGLCQIAVPALLALCLINLIAARAEGLGFIYFSNPDVILEVQTPANLASATGTIVNMVCLGITTLLGMVAAFFTVKTK